MELFHHLDDEFANIILTLELKSSPERSSAVDDFSAAESAIFRFTSSSLRIVKDISQSTLPTVLAVMHSSHEDTSAACWGRTLPAQPLDLAIAVDLVVLEHGQFHLLPLVLDLLRGGVHLLLALLRTAAESEDEVECRFLLDIVVGERAAVFELLAGEDQALLIGWDAFLVCRDGR